MTKKIPSLLSKILYPLGLAYGKILEQRRTNYAQGKYAQHEPNCPTVSVGNISWGGTGKTPFVSWLLNFAEEKNIKAVVLTRGYGGNTGSKPLLVEKDTPAQKCGDEPLLLAKKHPQSRVIAFADRKKSAKFAEEHIKPELFVLDDGMQHLGIKRHLDIVLLRPCDLDEEWNKTIPAGSWRENSSALKVAGAFAMKASELEIAKLEPLLKEKLAKYKVPFFSFTLCPTGLITLADFALGQNSFIPASLYEKSAYNLLSGVGEPEQVAKTAKNFMGQAPQNHLAFPDHHAYSRKDIHTLCSFNLPLICTAKDAVKLLAYKEEFKTTPVWVMDTKLCFGKTLFTSQNFATWFENWWLQKRKLL